MYAILMVCHLPSTKTPVMLASIYHATGSVMGCGLSVRTGGPDVTTSWSWIWDDLPSPGDEKTSPIARHNGTASGTDERYNPILLGRAGNP